MLNIRLVLDDGVSIYIFLFSISQEKGNGWLYQLKLVRTSQQSPCTYNNNIHQVRLDMMKLNIEGRNEGGGRDENRYPRLMQTKKDSNPSVSHVEEDAITFGEQLQHPAAVTHSYHKKLRPL